MAPAVPRRKSSDATAVSLRIRRHGAVSRHQLCNRYFGRPIGLRARIETIENAVQVVHAYLFADDLQTHGGPGAGREPGRERKANGVCAARQHELASVVAKREARFADATAERKGQCIGDPQGVSAVAGIEANDGIGAVAIDPVVPRAAGDEGVTLFIEIIVAAIALHEVVADEVPLFDVVIALPAQQNVLAGLAFRMAAPPPAEHHVAAIAAREVIAAAIAEKNIVAREAEERIVAIAATERVRAARAADQV